MNPMPHDWVAGLVGGSIIGCAAALFLLVNGRVMGASGIIGGLVDGSGHNNRSERWFFLGGLVAIPAVIVMLGAPITTHLTANPAVIMAAGLLVGVGTRVANGCTSGYGVCGLSRLSLRAMVATACYLLGGALSVLLFRHVMGWI